MTSGSTKKRTVTNAEGIDVGLTTLATLSDGTEIANPRWTRQDEERIAHANQVLARKQKRSKNRIRARQVLGRAHQRAANARRNYLHHVSKWLVANYDLIAHEALNIKGMAQGNLAKSIMDAAWSILLGQLTYKAEQGAAQCSNRAGNERSSGLSTWGPPWWITAGREQGRN